MIGLHEFRNRTYDSFLPSKSSDSMLSPANFPANSSNPDFSHHYPAVNSTCSSPYDISPRSRLYPAYITNPLCVREKLNFLNVSNSCTNDNDNDNNSNDNDNSKDNDNSDNNDSYYCDKFSLSLLVQIISRFVIKIGRAHV